MAPMGQMVYVARTVRVLSMGLLKRRWGPLKGLIGGLPRHGRAPPVAKAVAVAVVEPVVERIAPPKSV